MICFRRIWLLRKFYYWVIIFSMNNDVSVCNISMEWTICHQREGIKHKNIAYYDKSQY